ncbi:MAG: pyridoxal phosphate-dependent aminotransferase [Rhizobiaceae bacterium]
MTGANPHIARMSPYALSAMAAPDGKRLISLSQNESLRAPSPRAVAAAAGLLEKAALYPDPDWAELRHALGDLHQIASEGILCGNGSLDLIGCIARAFAGPGRAVLAPVHAYPFFRSAAQMVNARFDTAEEIEATVSVDALLSSVQPDTVLVFIANPGNPTGTRIPKLELQRLRAGLREDILLVIDEAYGEFADHLGETCFDMVGDGKTVVLRTFSKAYGMAGFRVGWGYFPPLIAAELRKVMNPNNVSSVGQAAAIAALSDREYMRKTCEQTVALRETATGNLRAAGFQVFPSHTNFILINLGSVRAAESANAALRAEGVFPRPQDSAGLPSALRMTIAPQSELDAAISRLVLWKKEYAS